MHTMALTTIFRIGNLVDIVHTCQRLLNCRARCRRVDDIQNACPAGRTGLCHQRHRSFATDHFNHQCLNIAFARWL